MEKKNFAGLIVPLVTPFKDGKIDYYSLEKIIAFLVENGADGFVALGTTAETPSLDEDERDEILSFTVKRSEGKFVIAGAGSNCTKTAIRLSQRAEELGADGILSVAPYYNLPQEDGVFAHYQAISSAVSVPVLLYDVPKRTGITLSTELVKRLSEIKNITGIKEASGDVNKFKELKKEMPSFDLYSGNDFLADEELISGAKGIISAAANAVPEIFAKLVNLREERKIATLRELFRNEKQTIEILYSETNPAAIKYFMSLKGLCENELRLPMCPVSRKNAEKLKKLYLKKEQK